MAPAALKRRQRRFDAESARRDALARKLTEIPPEHSDAELERLTAPVQQPAPPAKAGKK